MNVNECRLFCPNCASALTSPVPGNIRCSGTGCNYIFQVFGKRDKKVAEEFYLTQPSKKLKYIREAMDGRWLVAYGDKAEPFIAENLFDLIDPKALQTIQVGLSERLKRPMTIIVRFKEKPKLIPGQEFPVKIIEKAGQIFGRVDPINPLAYYCARCEKYRQFPEGENDCLDYDIEITQEMIISDEPISMWRLCQVGLVDYGIPVTINNFVVAVFITGQIRWIDPEGEQELIKGSKRASEIVSLTTEELYNLANDFGQLKADRSELDHLLEEYESVVKTISEIAENRYWAERRVRESEFFTEILSSFAVVENEESLRKVLKLVLSRLIEFSFFKYSAFLQSSEDSEDNFITKVAVGFRSNEHQLSKITKSLANEIFEKEALFPIKEAGQTKDDKLYQNILNLIGVDDLNCVFLFPCLLGAVGRALIILAERTEIIPGHKNIGRISKLRKEFLERIVHEIKVEVQSQITITKLRKTLQEKSDLMDTAAHVLVAPLDSAYGKIEHLKSLVSRDDPSYIDYNEIEIRELCQGIDEDIIRSIQKTRSFMFFTTIGMDAEEYRFDKPISLIRLLKELTMDFQYLAKRRGITIEMSALDELPFANFDRNKLEILFSNLLDNAVKYSHSNRIININISFDKKSDIYTISISDFGVGIHECEYSKIFEKYYRSEKKDPRRFIPGTGIGLSVVKEIVAKHGGKVWITSKRGPTSKGESSIIEGFNTTFYVQIHRERKILS